jgi:hypothetical protein
MSLCDSDIPMNVPITFRNEQLFHEGWTVQEPEEVPGAAKAAQ